MHALHEQQQQYLYSDSAIIHSYNVRVRVDARANSHSSDGYGGSGGDTDGEAPQAWTLADAGCPSGCLFDILADPEERTDLAWAAPYLGGKATWGL